MIYNPQNKTYQAPNALGQDHFNWLSEFLASNGINPPNGSPLKDAISSAKSISHDNLADIKQLPSEQMFQKIRIGIDLLSFSAILHKAPKILQDNSHLFRVLFSGSDISFISGGPQNSSRDKAWEVYCAAAVCNCAVNVVLAEPDVLLRYHNYSVGLACKMIYTTNINNVANRIIEGAKQIESCHCDFGIVIANLSPTISHADFMFEKPGSPGIYWGFNNGEKAVDALGEKVNKFVLSMKRQPLIRRLSNDSVGNFRTRTRGIIYFAQTVVRIDGIPSLISYGLKDQFRNILSIESQFMDAYIQSAGTSF